MGGGAGVVESKLCDVDNFSPMHTLTSPIPAALKLRQAALLSGEVTWVLSPSAAGGEGTSAETRVKRRRKRTWRKKSEGRGNVAGLRSITGLPLGKDRRILFSPKRKRKKTKTDYSGGNGVLTI